MKYYLISSKGRIKGFTIGSPSYLILNTLHFHTRDVTFILSIIVSTIKIITFISVSRGDIQALHCIVGRAAVECVAVFSSSVSNICTIIVIIIIIIVTRPKPPSGRQGLAGSWGKDTVRQVHYMMFSTSHFAPLALSSDWIVLI